MRVYDKQRLFPLGPWSTVAPTGSVRRTISATVVEPDASLLVEFPTTEYHDWLVDDWRVFRLVGMTAAGVMG